MNRTLLCVLNITLSLSLLTTCSSFLHSTSIEKKKFQINAPSELYRQRKNRDKYDNYDDNDEDDDFDVFSSSGKRQGLSSNDSEDGTLNTPSPFGKARGLRLPSSLSKAILAGVFLVGIGTGVTVDSAINTNPRDLASRDAIDQAAPNPNICASYGASAMAFDQRVFVSFNPFNVYVAQADVKPACVLRPANAVPILRERGLINDKEVNACKQKMNTWAFVGELKDMPQISCVYQSDDAQNEFLEKSPKLGIGEDVWDDDRIKMATNKNVKNALTQGQVNLKNNKAGDNAKSN